uniref:TnpV protein n=1 Tax=Tannockella kyphosi TaxID=2899121 RepID=UPI002012986F|nr:TnpV protein [Tannockella kyphosi]
MNNLTYKTEGDYKIPNLELKQEQPVTLGKYGKMRKAHLMEHRKPLFNHLLLSEKLTAHLVEIDQTANRRMEQLMKDLEKKQPSPNKMTHQLEWVAHQNSLQAQAEEVILTELIYS